MPWQISCNDTFPLCIGELLFAVTLIACVLFTFAKLRRKCQSRRRGYSPIRRNGGTEMLGLVTVEDEGTPRGGDDDESKPVMMGLTSSLESLSRRHKHMRNSSWGSAISLEDLEDDRTLGPSSARAPRRSGRARQGHQHDDDDELSSWTISVDDYAPQLSELTAWVKSSLPDVAVPTEGDVAAAVAEARVVQAAVTEMTVTAATEMMSGMSPYAYLAPNSPSRASLHAGPPSPEAAAAASLEAAEEGSVGAAAAAAAAGGGDAGPSIVAVPHSSLHAVTLAWRQTLPSSALPSSSNGDRSGGAGGAGGGVEVAPLLEALDVAVGICELFGPLMAPAVKNDRSNCDKVGQPERPNTVPPPSCALSAPFTAASNLSTQCHHNYL